MTAGSTTVDFTARRFALARFTSHCTLDELEVTDVGPGDDHAEAVAIQGDGKILAAGGSGPGSAPTMFALACYESPLRVATVTIVRTGSEGRNGQQ